MARESAQTRVERGAALLDKHVPGWHRRITLEELDLSSCQNCICGQLALTSRARMVREFLSIGGNRLHNRWWGFVLFLAKKTKVTQYEFETYDHGFVPSNWSDHRKDPVEREWRRIIRERLEAEAA